MTVDEKLKKLEEITNKLENDNIGFDESIKLYEDGVNLSKELYKELETIKGKVYVIKEDLEKFKEEEIK